MPEPTQQVAVRVAFACHAQRYGTRRQWAELLDGGRFPSLAEAKLEISHHVAYYKA